MITTQRLVERSLAAFADRVAVVDHDRSITYATLDQRSRFKPDDLEVLASVASQYEPQACCKSEVSTPRNAISSASPAVIDRALNHTNSMLVVGIMY